MIIITDTKCFLTSLMYNDYNHFKQVGHRGQMTQKHTMETALCDIKTLEKLWNKTQSDTNNNVRKNFVNKVENNQRFKMIDMGAFCMTNDITPDMLKMGVRHIKEVAALLDGKEASTHNKIVVMSEEDYKTYELFKKMKAFQDSQK